MPQQNMKAMKTMKAMKVSKVARGHGAKARVFTGKKESTGGGLTKDKLTRNKRGKVVSKAASARSKKAFASSPLKAWSDATKAARKALGLTGFVPVGGKTAAGKALYAKAKSLM
jgi:hypothetical protein